MKYTNDKTGVTYTINDKNEESTKNVDNSVLKKGWSEDWLAVKEMNATFNKKISAPYNQNYVVYKAVSAIAKNAPQANYVIYSNDKPLDYNDPANRLFMRPNPVTSRFELWETTITYLQLRGEVFWCLNKSNQQLVAGSGLPAEIYVLDPKHMSHKLNKERTAITRWIYNKTIVFDADEIIHFKLFNPNNQLRGLSPMEAVMLEVESDYASAMFNRKLFSNSARPDAILNIHPDYAQAVTEEDERKIVKQWETKYKGASNANKIAILKGMEYQPISLTPHEMDFLKTRNFNRNAILAVYDVPPEVAGFHENATYNNIQTAFKIFWLNNVKPMLLRIQEKLQAELFDANGVPYLGKFEFGGVEALRPDITNMLDAGSKAIQMGFTRNEVNEKYELGFEEDNITGNERYLPISLVPINAYDEPDGDTKSTHTTDSTTKSTTTTTTATPTATTTATPTATPTNGTSNNNTTTKAANYNRYRTIYLRKQQRHVDLFHAKLKRYLYEQRKEILSLLPVKLVKSGDKNEIIAGIINILEKQNVKLVEFMRPLYDAAQKDASQMALDNLGLNTEPIANTSVVNSMTNKIKGINDTTFSKIKDVLQTGLNEGQTLEQIADEIKNIYNFTTSRAKVIARTETGKIMNTSTAETYIKNGVRKKVWVGGQRDTHVDNASKGEVDWDYKYNGGLRWPGDDGPAKEVINCTCTLAPVIE